MATLSHSDLETLWILHGGTQQTADVAAAIAQAESGGCQYAKAGPTDDRPVKQCVYRQTTLENSYGLWQINRNAHPQYGAASLYTPAGNAAAAVAIANGGLSFSAWSTFENGAYKAHLTGTVSVTPQPGTTVTTSSGASTASGLRGYADLRNSVARHLPTQLTRSRRATRGALQAVAHGRKVKR